MRRGFSLMEVVVALSLLALLLPVLMNLFPMSEMARRKAERMQSATSLALQWLEEAQVRPAAAPGVDRDQTVELNGARFRARREFVATGTPGTIDVVVTVERNGSQPIRLATRVALKL